MSPRTWTVVGALLLGAFLHATAQEPPPPAPPPPPEQPPAPPPPKPAGSGVTLAELDDASLAVVDRVRRSAVSVLAVHPPFAGGRTSVSNPHILAETHASTPARSAQNPASTNQSCSWFSRLVIRSSFVGNVRLADWSFAFVLNTIHMIPACPAK